MEVYDLTVCVVAVDGPGGTITRCFRLMAKAFNGSRVLYSALLNVHEYRAAMQSTNLTIDQIEFPIRTGSHTMFAGCGGGDKTFQRIVLEEMGMRPELL